MNFCFGYDLAVQTDKLNLTSLLHFLKQQTNDRRRV